MSATPRVLQILADGNFHSGEAIAASLGVSRVAVWKQLRKLAPLAIEVEAVRGKGYRLMRSLELLDTTRVLAAVGPQGRRWVSCLEIHQDLDSTNRQLMSRAADALSGSVCIAERQRAGRGRQGRPWVSPFGANIYLSLLWRFDVGPNQLSGLGLATAVALARALRGGGVRAPSLKWPNDIFVEGRKLAGVLVEVTGEAAGPCAVVVGVGVNVAMPASAGAHIDQPWIDVQTVLGRSVSRNQLAGRIIRELIRGLREFDAAGLEPFLPEWSALDCTVGRVVTVRTPSGVAQGVARGVDATGALVIETTGGRRQRYLSGEVSVRAIGTRRSVAAG